MNRRDFIFGLGTMAAVSTGCIHHADRVTVGSKNFTEQLVLGELLAQLLEMRISSPVDRRFYLAGSYICHQAIIAGRIDIYVEYTGTALAAILKEPAYSNDPEKVYQQVKTEYSQKFGLEAMPSLGFNNSFAMVMRGQDARQLGVKKLSQLEIFAPKLKLGVGYEFLERPDGYPGLAKIYALKFAENPRVMDLGLLYRALEQKQVDVIAGSNTDGLIAAMGLVVLDDDRRYFPPYDAIPIVRPTALDRQSVRSVMESLSGRINADEMRNLNFAVEGKKRDVSEVVADFLKTKTW